MSLQKEIYQMADRIIRRAASMDNINTDPLEKQIEDTAKNIIEIVGEIDGLGKTAGISLDEQHRVLDHILLSNKGLSADVERILKLGELVITRKKVSNKIIGIYVKIRMLVEKTLSKLKKYDTFAHNIKDKNDLKNSYNTLSNLFRQYNIIVSKMEKGN